MPEAPTDTVADACRAYVTALEADGSKANQNRNWTPLRAALNLAVARGRVSPTVAAQWRAVKPYPMPTADGPSA